MGFDWGSFYNQLITSGATACFTIVAGVVVFVTGQFAVKLFVEPIQYQSKLLGEIANALVYYANAFGYAKYTTPEALKEISIVFRKQASDLYATAWSIKLYGLWQVLGIIPKKKNVLDASTQLIGLSNMIFRDGDTEYYKHFDEANKEIKRLLGFK